MLARTPTGIAGLAMLVLGLAPAFAEDAPTLADLGKNAELAAAFKAMAGETEMPDWLEQPIVTTPTATASFDGKPWQVMYGCKQHDCAAHRIAVIYSAEAGKMYGVVSDTSENGEEETLHWLNIGGGPESIDGRTILYAALTGSLANHPGAFDYSAD
ncbi:MAG TPA: Ivy family c-type lysozyme inhibitor [Paracoccus sp. (in: a-proteobacteria)]|uniref:Ivy family c-type lysozyme inhibitor n=1 Tax=Paracoccus sp. TaxID=267 RepID=UPI002CC8E3F6|nr:Ivy family c-type lysozyme inhibitor [Paracoccus sp. (in: a-proteobacteria)]HWL55396.1 Ivy family c-type lysozyme inhibitor [Paracoccus sp. (in: a-proteobacteria)]